MSPQQFRFGFSPEDYGFDTRTIPKLDFPFESVPLSVFHIGLAIRTEFFEKLA